MTDKPRNKWFRGDNTPMAFEVNEIAVSRGCCSHNVGQKGFIREAPDKAFWSNQWEYAIVPLDDLNLDTEEPEPELVIIKGCGNPLLRRVDNGWRAESRRRVNDWTSTTCVSAVHPNKHVAIEAYNAAAEALNKHGGV